MPVIKHGKKIARIIAGGVLLAVGLALSLPGVPGPGIAVIVLGLSVLSVDFEFARRWVARMKDIARRTARRLGRGDSAV